MPSKNLVFLAAVVVVVVALCGTANAQWRFAWISDPHYDPQYASAKAVASVNKNCTSTDIPKIGMFGCDGPLSLVTSFLDDMDKEMAPTNSATEQVDVVITGDLLRHDFSEVGNQSYALQLLEELFDVMIAKAGPKRSLHFVGSSLGNNDVVPNYFVNLTDTAHPYFHAVATMLQSKGVMSAVEAQRYAKCGFYAREVATRTSPRVTILSLNTVVWSASHSPRDETPVLYPDPCGQFQWMDEQLTKGAADGNRVFYITGHIPPGIDSHPRWDGKPGWTGSTFYHAAYNNQFAGLLKKHRDVIVGQLFAHTHHFTARLFKDLPQPLLITTGITPVYYNYPSYMVVETDPKAQHRVARLRQRWLNITDQHGPGGSGGAPVVWQDNSNGPLVIDNSAVPGSVYQSVAAWTHNWQRYMTYINGGRISTLEPPCDTTCVKYSNCSVFHHVLDTFDTCVQK